MTGGLKMGVNVAAHTRHVFLGSAHPRDFSGTSGRTVDRIKHDS